MVAESNPPAPAEEMSEEAMMAMMGFGSFGTTKVCPFLVTCLF